MKKAILLDTTGMPYQDTFMESKKPKVFLSSGFGGGKTYILVMKMFQLMELNRRCPGGFLSPSYKMYKRDVIPTIKDICRENRIRYDYHKSDMLWTFPDAGAHVYAFTAEDPDSIKGPNLAWFCINEVGMCSEQAFLMSIGRVRLKRANVLQIAMSGTPEGFTWTYDYFVTAPRKDTDLVFGDARLNTHVAESYFKGLEESYDPLMQEQYIKGMFVNLKGKRCAWAFNRHRHTDKHIEKIEGWPVWISMDFNVTPMSATLWNRVPLGFHTDDRWGRCMLRAFDEITIDGSNTYEMAAALRDRLPKDQQGQLLDDITIYPDPAGRSKSTKSMNLSDFDILKQHGFQNIKFKLQISVKDCLNALNGIIAKDLMVLNSDTCTNTIADLEQCVFKGNVFEIDKSNPRRTHWLDGTKNMCDYEFAIKRSSFREQRMR